MNPLERTHPQSTRQPEAPAAGQGPRHLNELRRQAAALQAAADTAIRNALSTDSQAFNASMRQEGGQ